MYVLMGSRDLVTISSLSVHSRFNVYIHDYFLKRGFRKAAKELVVEAEIGNDASPPINARQGFLFECVPDVLVLIVV